jgi:hypothetical protein
MANFDLPERDIELLSAYLDDALTPAERAELDVRLQAETSLRQELDALRQTVNAIRALPTLKPPRPLTLTPAQVRPRGQVRALPTGWRMASVAAVVVLLVGVGALLISRTERATPQIASAPTALAPAQDVTPEVAELTNATTLAEDVTDAGTREGEQAGDSAFAIMSAPVDDSATPTDAGTPLPEARSMIAPAGAMPATLPTVMPMPTPMATLMRDSAPVPPSPMTGDALSAPMTTSGGAPMGGNAFESAPMNVQSITPMPTFESESAPMTAFDGAPDLASLALLDLLPDIFRLVSFLLSFLIGLSAGF